MSEYGQYIRKAQTLEKKPCRAIFRGGVEKRGIIDFVDDTGNLFILFRDGSTMRLTYKEYLLAKEESSSECRYGTIL